MANMTMAIPDELHSKMRQYPEIKWTTIAKQAFEKTVRILESEKDPWRMYAYRRWAEEGEDAEKLFKL